MHVIVERVKRVLNARNFPVAVLLVLLLIMTSHWWSPKPTVAPDVTFTTLTGERVSLTALRGKPVIVTFWATDCPSCINEIPDLQALYASYHARGLELIAIAMYYDPPSHVVAMTADKQLLYQVALDLKAELAAAFGHVELTPTTFLIAPDGAIVLQYTGAMDIAAMTRTIDTFL